MIDLNIVSSHHQNSCCAIGTGRYVTKESGYLICDVSHYVAETNPKGHTERSSLIHNSYRDKELYVKAHTTYTVTSLEILLKTSKKLEVTCTLCDFNYVHVPTKCAATSFLDFYRVRCV